EGGAEQRRPRRRAGTERCPSPSRLDVSSSRFDPLLALYSASTPLPFPSAPCFNNLAEYESFQRGLLRPRGRRSAPSRRGPPASRSARRGPPASDPERIQRIQRLRSLMVNAGHEQEAAEGGGTARRRRAPRNVLTRMPRKCGRTLRGAAVGKGSRGRLRAEVEGVRGWVCAWWWKGNAALTDVDETYRKPVMGKAFYAEPQLSLTRLFNRLKLQDSSVKKGADSKTVSEERALTNDSQTLGSKSGSGQGRGEDERERQKHLGRAGEKKMPGDSLHLAARDEADVGSGTARTEGASAGGTRTRSQSRRKRRPKVDYQQVFTRHINQIFIRGENVLLVHLAH
ncbi:LSM11 protein, partial [Eolophus roseicapillus]|nr:LSM11 protein [Eolophus roseicapilla]